VLDRFAESGSHDLFGLLRRLLHVSVTRDASDELVKLYTRSISSELLCTPCGGAFRVKAQGQSITKPPRAMRCEFIHGLMDVADRISGELSPPLHHLIKGGK